MNIIEEKEKIVYKFTTNDKVSYAIGISKKKQDGTYENGYIPVRFQKDVNLENKTRIKIKNAWLDFFKKEKKTYLYIFINEFEKIEQQKQEEKPIDNWDAGKNVEIDDDMLPFYN